MIASGLLYFRLSCEFRLEGKTYVGTTIRSVSQQKADKRLVVVPLLHGSTTSASCASSLNHDGCVITTSGAFSLLFGEAPVMGRSP